MKRSFLVTTLTASTLLLCIAGIYEVASGGYSRGGMRGREPNAEQRAQINAAIDEMSAARGTGRFRRIMRCMIGQTNPGGICVANINRAGITRIHLGRYREHGLKGLRINLGVHSLANDSPKETAAVLVHEVMHTTLLNKFPDDDREKSHCRVYLVHARWLDFFKRRCGNSTPAGVCNQLKKINDWYPEWNGTYRPGWQPFVPGGGDDVSRYCYNVRISLAAHAVSIHTDGGCCLQVATWPEGGTERDIHRYEVPLGMDLIPDFTVSYDSAGKPRVLALATLADLSQGGLFVVEDADGDGDLDDVSLVDGTLGTRYGSAKSVVFRESSSGPGDWFVLEGLDHQIWKLDDLNQDGLPDGPGQVYCDRGQCPDLAEALDITTDDDQPNGLLAVSMPPPRGWTDDSDWIVSIDDADGDGVVDTISPRILIGDTDEFPPTLTRALYPGDLEAKVCAVAGHTMELRAFDDFTGDFTRVLGSAVAEGNDSAEIRLNEAVGAGDVVVVADVTAEVLSPAEVVKSTFGPEIHSLSVGEAPADGVTEVTITGRFLPQNPRVYLQTPAVISPEERDRLVHSAEVSFSRPDSITFVMPSFEHEPDELREVHVQGNGGEASGPWLRILD